MRGKEFPQKKVLSLVLCVAVMLSVMVMGAGAAFSDQDKIENTEAVDACSALNIIGGYEDGSYHPERNIKRSEITKMICVALNGGKEPNLATPGTPTFSDVRGTTAAWAEKYIESCVSQGIVSGVGGGRFSPAGNVTASQLAKMLLVCLGYDADIEEFTGNAWDTNVNVVATQKGIYEGLSGLDVSAALTRDNAAQMVWNALQATEVTYKYTLVSENGQLVSKVELVDKTGENGNKITLLEDKYSGAGIYEGILTGAGELGTAGKDKIGMSNVDKLNGATLKEDEVTNQIWTYSDDVTNLYMQYVKVLVNNKGDAYGVFPVAKENTVVTAAFSDVELVSKATSTADGKVKIDGTEYKFAWIDGDPGAAAPIQGLTNKTMNDLKKEASNSADVITFISNDGDNKFDLAIVNPMIEFGKVTYVGEDEITAAGETYDPAEDIIPDDLAKDDYVAIYKDLYTDNYKLVKADKVSGKVTGTKGNPATDVKVDGTWYALAAEKNGSFDGMVGIAGKEASNGGTYDLYCINGVAYYVDEKQAGSTDTAYVLAAPGSMDTDGNYQVKLLFADGSTKVIGADQPYNSGFVGELVTYDINDGAYELKKVASGNTAGGDSVVTLKSFDKTKKKVTTDSGDYRVADSAVVYVIYKDGGDKQKVISGETLNALGANFGTSGTAVIDDGLATVVLLKSNSYLPGSNADKLYGYVTSDVVSNKEDDISFRSFTVWTSEEESIEVKVKSESADIKKGDLISFEMTEDNFIESVKSESEADIGYQLNVSDPVAIKDFTASWVSFYYDGDYDLADDAKYLYVNTADSKGVKGGSLSEASETANEGVYYANAKYVLNDDKEIVLIVVDTKNKWDDAETVKKDAAAPKSISLTAGSGSGLTVNGFTYDAAKKTYEVTASTFAASSADKLKLTVTTAEKTKDNITVSGDPVTAGEYTSGSDLTLTKAGKVTFKVTISQDNCNDVVYTINVTVS